MSVYRFFSGAACGAVANIFVSSNLTLRNADGTPIVDPMTRQLRLGLLLTVGTLYKGLQSGDQFFIGLAFGLSMMLITRAATDCFDTQSPTCPPVLKNFAGFSK